MKFRVCANPCPDYIPVPPPHIRNAAARPWLSRTHHPVTGALRDVGHRGGSYR